MFSLPFGDTGQKAVISQSAEEDSELYGGFPLVGRLLTIIHVGVPLPMPQAEHTDPNEQPVITAKPQHEPFEGV